MVTAPDSFLYVLQARTVESSFPLLASQVVFLRLNFSLQKDAASESVADDSRTKMHSLSSSVQDGLGQSSTKEDLREEVACLTLKLSYSDKMLDSKIASLSESLMKDQEELWQLEKEVKEDLHQSRYGERN